MHALVYYLKAQCLVNNLRFNAIKPSVRCHLAATLKPRPSFGCGQKVGCRSLAAVHRQNVPAFNETNRPAGIAAVGVRTKTNVDKTREATTQIFSNKDRQLHLLRKVAFN